MVHTSDTRTDDDGDEAATATRARVREFVVDANDGIIAIASIGEGFIGAGASTATALLAVVSATIAGSISLAGSRYSEVANERDALKELVEEEARRLSLSPEEELAELTSIYKRKGLSPELAASVAHELSQGDPLAAHVDAEYGLGAAQLRRNPLVAAVNGGVAFAAGALFIILAVWLSPSDERTRFVVAAALAALVLTSALGARWGHVPVRRTVMRTASIGAIALLVSYLVGTLFDL